MAEGQGRSSNQGVKLLYIRDYLHKYTNKEHPKSAKEICEYLASKGIKADRKTIYNDILRLQVDFQEPIQYNPKRWGYYIAEPIFSLYELQILTDCVRASEILSAKEVSSITKRISELTNIYDCKKLTENSVWTQKESTRPISGEMQNVDIIKRAIEQNKKISFRYFRYRPTSANRASGGKEYFDSCTGTTTFIVSPKELYCSNGSYTLVSYCSDNRIRSIMDYIHEVKYMEEISILPSDRECNDAFEPELEPPFIDFDDVCAQFLDLHQSKVGMTDKENDRVLADAVEDMKRALVEAEDELFTMMAYCDLAYTTTLRFDKRDTIHVLNEFGYDTVIVPQEDDECTATIRIEINRHFFNWLFSHQPLIMIEAPTIVENMYLRYIDAASKQYLYKYMEPGEVIVKFMELMEKKVKDKKLLNRLKEQYIVVEDEETFRKVTKDPTFRWIKNLFGKKKAK